MSGFELVDVTSHLPGLKHRPGLTTWTPSVDRSVVTDFTSYHDFIQSLPEDKRAETKLTETHWPPSHEDAERLRITRWFVAHSYTPSLPPDIGA